MDRRYVLAGRIAGLSFVLFLSACQQNTVSNSNSAKDIVATPSDSTADVDPVPGHTGQGPIIELAPEPAEVAEVKAPPAESSVAMPESAQTTTSQVAQPPVNSADAPNVSQPVTEKLAVDAQPASTSNTVVTSTPERVKPTFGNVATDDERNQKIAVDWPKPQVVFYVSGQQQGYIEPCGCTGLESQKGGLIRRDTVLTMLRDRGWEVLPVDVGNQNRHKRSSGPQPQIKFNTTVKSMQLMGYTAASLGVHDLELSRVELINMGASDPDKKPGSTSGPDRPFISGNVVVYGISGLFPAYKIVEAGGRKIGITSVIGNEFKKDVVKPGDDEIEYADPVASLKKIVPDLKSQGCDYVVLLSHASLGESADLGKCVEGIDLVVTAGGYGEPTLLPEPIADSKAVMVQVGTKGMYGGIVGLFDDPTTPIRYQKIAISSQFKDSDRMLKQFADYQDELKKAGFRGLGLTPALHPSTRTYVGSETCGECHTQAYEIWKDSPHFHATDSIVAANNDRGGIERHYDPECVSCHVTGWNPQQFTPFQTGYASLTESKHLLGSGCENCHGPGSAHVAAENGSATTTEQEEYRQEMILPLAKAEAKCMECHDFDNSPDFHAPGAFDEYWERVKHYGKD